MKRWLLVLILGITSVTAQAKVEIREFSSVEQEQRYKSLINELRCLVCQNQNLADSDAELAQDLRKQTYAMIQQGKSDQEIIEFMVSRYGDFVLYRPPFKSSTAILWIGPFIILLLGILVLILFIRKRNSTVVTEISVQERKQLDDLLEGKE